MRLCHQAKREVDDVAFLSAMLNNLESWLPMNRRRGVVRLMPSMNFIESFRSS
jgi:hypothetical protein